MTDSKRILLVAATTGYQTAMFLEAAGRLGYEVVLATDRCHVLDDPWRDRAVPVRFEDPEGAAAALAENGRVDGIVALGDRPAYLAALTAERLGLPYNSAGSVAASRNKHRSRELFREAGLPVPEYSRLALEGDEVEFAQRAQYPCVLKPLGLSASRGVIRANNPGEFAAAFARIRALLQDPDIRRFRDGEDAYLQVEAFIPGREFALEGLLTGGVLSVLALFDKPDPLDGPYFEETIYVTPSRASASIQREIAGAVARGATSLGLTHGPVHAEVRVNAAGVWLLEIAARPIGGLCAKVLPGLPELLLRHCAGDLDEIAAPPQRGAAVMMIPIPAAGVYVDTAGVEEARQTPGIEDVIVTAKPGQQLVPLPEGNSYLGFIFSRTECPNDAELAVRAAHGTLRFEILTALPILSA